MFEKKCKLYEYALKKTASPTATEKNSHTFALTNQKTVLKYLRKVSRAQRGKHRASLLPRAR